MTALNVDESESCRRIVSFHIVALNVCYMIDLPVTNAPQRQGQQRGQALESKRPMGLEEQLLAAAIENTFSEAWQHVGRLNFIMRGSTSDNTVEGPHADELHDAEDTLAFYVDKAFRDTGILAERLGLPLFRHDIAERRAGLKDLSAVKLSNDGDWYSQALADARIFYDSLQTMTNGRAVTGLGVFHTILENTPKIITARELIPSNEAQVRQAVMDVLEFYFRDVVREIPIAQNIKTYKPDIGVRSLMAAAEYKFVSSRKETKAALDGIYTDMKGYGGRYDWRSFYAVFYMTGHFYSQKDVDEEFCLVKAELSWTPIVVVGPGARAA
jgi:hypothetical protein